MPTRDIKPFFVPSGPPPGQGESGPCQTLIDSLSMIPHIEGGYFVETDRDPSRVPSPFPLDSTSNTAASMPQRPGFDPAFRNASTSIHYLLTPISPQVSPTPLDLDAAPTMYLTNQTRKRRHG